jgi:hypothetical protein
LRPNLEREARRCGNCRFCKRFSLLYDNTELERLKVAAKNILEISPERPAIRNNDIITILAVHGKLANKNIYSQKKRAWV